MMAGTQAWCSIQGESSTPVHSISLEQVFQPLNLLDVSLQAGLWSNLSRLLFGRELPQRSLLTRPVIVFFDNTAQDLKVTSRSSGVWTTEAVEEDGDVGRSASLAIDGQGIYHVSYMLIVDGGDDIVRYARRENGMWTLEDIDFLSSHTFGTGGARRTTSLVVTDDDEVMVAYGDTTRIALATRSTSGTWTTEVVAEPTSNTSPLGQDLSLVLDPQGVPTIVYHELDNTGLTVGQVWFTSRSESTVIDSSDETLPMPQLSLYPNPASGVIRLNIFTRSGGQASLTVYDIQGRIVHQVEVFTTPGPADLSIDSSGWAPGWYYLKLQTFRGEQSGKSVLIVR